MERILAELIERGTKAHAENLMSVVLYGSGVEPEDKDFYSDYNVLFVLQEVTPARLKASEPVFRWWRQMNNPAPLIMSLEELQNSSDCFPIEYHDMKEHYRILHGTDVVAPLVIDSTHYRAHVERELRAKVFRLRQKAAGVLGEPDLLLRLMVESLSTFCVLFRHALRLSGNPSYFSRRQIAESAAATFGIDARCLLELIDLRDNKVKARDLKPADLFPRYLEAVGTVVLAVNRMQR